MSGNIKRQRRQIILVGKSGNGKSATGNSVLGKELFEGRRGLGSVTQQCQIQTRFRSDTQCEFSVVDTPGLFDTDQPFAKRALEIQRALECCPNPHAFLIVLRADARFTSEENSTIDMLRVIFGEIFLKHAILVFTRGSEFKSDDDLNTFIKENEIVDNLRNECNGKVAMVENNPSIDGDIRDMMIKTLFQTIEDMSERGQRFYKYKSLGVHRKILEDHLKNRKPDATLSDDLQQLVEELGRQLKNKESWRPYVLGGLIGATTVGSMAYAAPLLLASRTAVAAAPSIASMAGSAFVYARQAVVPAGGYVLRGTAAAFGAGASALGKLAALRFK